MLPLLCTYTILQSSERASRESNINFITRCTAFCARAAPSHPIQLQCAGKEVDFLSRGFLQNGDAKSKEPGVMMARLRKVCNFRHPTLPSLRRSFSTKLNWETVEANNVDGSAVARKSILFLHGLLGSGRNLKTLATKVCSQESSLGVLMDLRGHGKSVETHPHPRPPHTFDACVQDVKETLTYATSNSPSLPWPSVVVGHSWGGRVALQYAASVASSSTKSPKLDRVWLLDTVPGQANDSVERVVEAVTLLLKDSSDSQLTRKQVLEELTQTYDLDVGLAQWLASSYRSTSDNKPTFGFDLDVVHGVLSEFEEQDFLGLVDICSRQNIRVDLVRGGKNTGWTIDILRELQALQGPSFHVHVLPQAGHWVHVDDLPGLLNLMKTQST